MNSIETAKILVAVFLIGCFVEKGFCIKCWECRSDSDPKCADPFDNSTVPISDCKQKQELDYLDEKGIKATMCRKIRQKVNGEWKYFRSCAYLGEPGIQRDERFCLMRTGSYNIFMEYCTCNSKDGCNSATVLNVSRLTALCAGLLVISCIFKLL